MSVDVRMTIPRACSTSRLYAAALALVLVGGHVGSVVHFARVSHGVCAAHGEAIHIEAGAEHTHADDPTFAGNEAAAHGHDDHCLVALAASERSLEASVRGASVDVLAAEAPSLGLEGERVLSDRTRFRFAPKLSPPSFLSI